MDGARAIGKKIEFHGNKSPLSDLAPPMLFPSRATYPLDHKRKYDGAYAKKRGRR
jgi:hypothetical protein